MLGSMGVQTVAQRGEKIQRLTAHGIFGTSGHRGTGQQLFGEVDRHAKDFHKYTCDKALKLIQKGFREVLNPLYETAGRVPGGTQEVVTGGLLAAKFRDGLHLVEIGHTITVEKMTDDVPFVTMGSGKSQADSLLGFLAGVYWPKAAPSLQEGKLAACWAVMHAIDMRVFGVGFSVDGFVLQDDADGSKAIELSVADIAEHADFVDSIKQKMLEATDFSTPHPGATPPPKLKDNDG